MLLLNLTGKRIRRILPAPRPSTGQFCVYVLKCSDESFYIGQTEDFPRRMEQHRKQEVSWTATRLPVEPIHWEILASREEAVKREQDLKTGYGRKWLKREYAAGRLAAASACALHADRSRQAGKPDSVEFEDGTCHSSGLHYSTTSRHPDEKTSK